MNIEQVEQLVEETIELIAVTSSSLADAKPRASRFLVVNSILSTFLRQLEEELPKFQTLLDAQYAQALNTVSGKGVTEKKVNAEASSEYSEARENKEKLNALRSWIMNHIKIFDHAHLMYRQYSRD